VSIFSGIVTDDGPLLDVILMVTVPRQNALRRNNMDVPMPVAARLLIDTGASHSSIDQRFVALLDLRPVGKVQIHTPSTGQTPAVADEFDIAIRLASTGSHAHEIPITPVFSCDHSEQGIDGLFGRDVLGGAILIYDGHRKSYTLSF